jgi:hypothetical protein
LSPLGLFFSILLVAGMFILLRRIERWLHQHIFKVGWLLTRNFQTTTILYYTFFLPGVFLHELTYWLGAGMLNVRATVSIPFFKKEAPAPKDDKQAKATAEVPKPPPSNTIDISKLKPNFVTLDFGTARGRGKQAQKGIYRKAIISVLPLFVALVCIWLIADNIFNIMGVVGTMASGELTDIVTAYNTLTGVPNFWLWIYIVFTIANTMFPFVPEELRGWRTVLITTVAVGLALTLIGIGGEIFQAMQSPLANLIEVMEVTLILIIIVDVVMVLALGTIEYIIEHVTGNTATFRGSTMEVMSRAEAESFREQELERQRRREERFERRRNKAADSNLSNVYMLMLPIPGAPGEEPITQVVEDKPAPVIKEKPVAAAPPPPPEVPAARPPTREKPEDLAARIHITERKPLVPRQPEPETDAVKDTEAEAATSLADRIAPFPSTTSAPDKSDDMRETVDEPVAEAQPISPLARQVVSPITDAEDSDEVKEAEPVSQISSVPAEVTKVNTDDDDEVEEEPAKPSATFRSTTLRPSPVAKPDEKDDEAEAEESKPAASLSSRFGVTPLRSPTPVVEDDTDDETDDKEVTKPATSLGSRSGVTPFRNPVPSIKDNESDTEDEEEEAVKPAASLSSRFGVTPFRSLAPSVEEDADEEEAVKPAASSSSRFGVTPFRSPAPDTETKGADKDDEPEVEKSPAVGLTPAKPKGLLHSEASDSEKTEEDETSSPEPDEPIKSSFSGSSFRGDSAADNKAEEEKPIFAGPKGLFTRPTVEDTDDEADERINTKPVAPLSSRFGVSPLKDLPSVENAEDEEKAEGETPPEDMTPAKPKGLVFTSDTDTKPPVRPTTSRLGTTPFSRPDSTEDEKDDTDEDESFLQRSGRGDDAVSDLFGGLNTGSKSDDTDDEEEEETDSRFSRFSSTPSRFGSRLSTFGRKSTTDDEGNEEQDKGGRFSKSGSTPSRFGSRPSSIGRRNTDDDDVEYADDDDYYDYDADDVDEYADDDDTDYVADDD